EFTNENDIELEDWDDFGDFGVWDESDDGDPNTLGGSSPADSPNGRVNDLDNTGTVTFDNNATPPGSQDPYASQNPYDSHDPYTSYDPYASQDSYVSQNPCAIQDPYAPQDPNSRQRPHKHYRETHAGRGFSDYQQDNACAQQSIPTPPHTQDERQNLDRSEVQFSQNEPSRSVSEDDEPPLHRKRRAFKEHRAHFLDEVHEQHPQNEPALHGVSHALNEVKCEEEHNPNGSGNGPQGDTQEIPKSSEPDEPSRDMF
ncbi:hypothetical protein BGX20_005972, partial [Mortierella sp. AD010]